MCAGHARCAICDFHAKKDHCSTCCAPGHHAVESATANWRGARPTETRSHAPQPYRAFWVETHLRRLFAPSHMHPRNLARASCNLTEGSQKTAIRALFAFSTDGPQLPHANRCEGASDKSGRRFMRLSTDYQHCDFSPGLPGEKCVQKKRHFRIINLDPP